MTVNLLDVLYVFLAFHCGIVITLLINLLIVIHKNKRRELEIKQFSYILVLLSMLVWEITYLVLLVRKFRYLNRMIEYLQKKLESIEASRYDDELEAEEILEKTVQLKNDMIVKYREELKTEKEKNKKLRKKLKESG